MTEAKSVSRRAFVGAGAFTAAALALAGCSPDNKLSETSGDDEKAEVRVDADVDPNVNGEWIPVECANNCGGRCANYAYVVDGVVTRQKTDDYHDDSEDTPQQRSCLRGHALRRQYYGPDRLKYPMKRKHWEPLTGGDKSLRGRDEWERISWEEALDYVAAEIKHAFETYGNRSVFMPSNVPGGKASSMVLNAMGGAFYGWTTGSEGTFRFKPQDNYGFVGCNDMYGSDRFELMKAEHLVLYGCNPVWASMGNPAHYLDRLKRNGTKFYAVGPMYDATASLLDAEWIPVRVGTDAALLAAVAYLMIQRDAEGQEAIDWDYIDRCTVGFDDDRMPADAVLNENFKGYVLGQYDGTPKTPEWASAICGTPVEKIELLADVFGADHKTYIGFTSSIARQKGAESLPQMLMTVAAMGGHFGKEGHGCAPIFCQWAANAGTQLFQTTYMQPWDYAQVGDVINMCQAWDAVLTGKYINNGPTAAFSMFEPGVETDCDIRMLWFEIGAPMTTIADPTRGVEAVRSVDFVLNQSWTYRTEAQFADIVLPVTAPWENEDIGMDSWTSMRYANREFMFFARKATEPYYESHSDQWIAEQLLDRLGIDPKTMFPRTPEECRFNNLSKAQVLKPNGVDWENVISFTAEDIAELGVEGEPQDGLVPYQEIRRIGYYQIPRSEGDGYGFVAYKDFRDDPEANPRTSPSGKMEIYSDTYANLINNMGFSDTFTIKPYPTFIDRCEGNYQDTFEGRDIEGAKRTDYPLQLFTPHYPRVSHATMGNVDWLQEAMPDYAYVSTVDATERGVSLGDTIIVYNEAGKLLRKACPSERIVPGTVSIPHGGWLRWDEEEGLSRGGCENALNQGTSISGVHAYNSCLINFALYDGEPLEEDCFAERYFTEIQEA